MDEPYYIINSTVRTLDMLEYLAKVDEASVSEMSNQFKVNKSTAHRFLASMKYRGFLTQNEDNQKYKLSFKLFEIGNSVVSRLNIHDVARPIMDKLCQKTGETINLGVVDQSEVVYISKSVSSNSLRMDSPIGGRDPVYCTGLGKSILAFKSNETIRRYISENQFIERTSNTITDIEAFYEELVIIKEKGYALDREEIILGLCCIAAPIFNQERDPIAAISISVPKIRLKETGIEFYALDVLQASQQISMGMGAR